MRCFAITRNNTQCLNRARRGREFCGIHTPTLKYSFKLKMIFEKVKTFKK